MGEIYFEKAHKWCKMNYANIKFNDIANGIGVRTSLFVSGCRNCCEDCFNKETWNFNFGEPYTAKIEEQILKSLAPSYVSGLTVLGGEPLEKENQSAVLGLIKRVKAEYPNKTVWIFSGFTYDEIMGESRISSPLAREILSLADVLVDGRFERDKKNIALKFRGSENQRIIDLKQTNASKSVVLWEE